MKVTFLADKINLGQGGSNHSLNLTAKLLAERGHEVTVVTFNFVHDNDPPAAPIYDIVEDPVGQGTKVGKARRIYDRIGRYDEDADVLHVFNPAILPIAGYYRRRRGRTPVVGRLNTYDNFCSNLGRMTPTCYRNCTVAAKFRHDDDDASAKLVNFPEYIFDTYGLPRALEAMDQLFALSPSVRDIYASIGVERDSIEVVPNFLDPDFPDVDARNGVFDDEGFTVLYVGRLGKEKGVDLLIDAMEYLNSSSEYRVEIVGEGPQRAELEAEAASRSLSDRIRFHGWVPYSDLPGYYASADVFVHPGRWPEPFGRTMLESMQCGCPPIVSNIGAPPWIIGDCGRVFERDDPQDLASAVQEAVRGDVDTSAFAERLAAFDPETVVGQIESNYRRMLE